MGKITPGHFIFHQVTPFVVEYPFPGKLGFYPVQDRDGANRGAVVIAPQHHRVGCIGADNGNLPFLARERQDVVVVPEQCHGLLRHPVGQLPVLFAIQDRGGDLRPGNQGIVIKIAEVKTADQHTQQAFVNVFFPDQPALNAFRQRLVGIILPDAFHIGPGQYGFGGGMYGC